MRVYVCAAGERWCAHVCVRACVRRRSATLTHPRAVSGSPSRTLALSLGPHQALNKEPPPYIRARPMEDDILKFHYVLEGPPGTPYAGGYYHGILKFPSEVCVCVYEWV